MIEILKNVYQSCRETIMQPRSISHEDYNILIVVVFILKTIVKGNVYTIFSPIYNYELKLKF